MQHTYAVRRILFVLAWFCSLSIASAAELNIDQVDVTIYEELKVDLDNSYTRGIVETLRIPDKRLLATWVTFNAQWDENTKQFKTDSKNIVLIDSEGNQIQPIGMFEHLVVFKKRSPSLYISKPYNWQKKETHKPRFNAVFAVPQDSETFTLQIGDLKQELSLPETISSNDPTRLADLSIVEVEFVDELSSSFKTGGQEFETRITPLSGKLLAVTLTITPKMDNAASPDNFYWHTSWVGLLDEKGDYLNRAGESSSSGVNANVSHNSEKKPDIGWETQTATLYFVALPGMGDFQLTFLTQPISGAETMPSEEEVSQEITLDRKTVRQVQAKLKELGYKPGSVDGAWGKKTETALKKFQEDVGISVTGKLDEETQEKLGL